MTTIMPIHCRYCGTDNIDGPFDDGMLMFARCVDCGHTFYCGPSEVRHRMEESSAQAKADSETESVTIRHVLGNTRSEIYEALHGIFSPTDVIHAHGMGVIL